MAHGNDILQELEAHAPELARVSPSIPYNVPAGYFKDLPGIILMRIKTMSTETAEEEIRVLSPALGNLKRKTPYKVPNGYFENLVARPVQQVPVRSISFTRRTWQYAAAAVIAGVVGFGAWFASEQSAVKNTTVFAQNDSLTGQELTNISDAEIENFLEGSISTINFEPSGSSTEIKDEDARLMLAEIPDKELENYLN